MFVRYVISEAVNCVTVAWQIILYIYQESAVYVYVCICILLLCIRCFWCCSRLVKLHLTCWLKGFSLYLFYA